MKEKITGLIQEAIAPLGLVVSDVYYSTEEGLKTLNIELDADFIIDIDKITEATKIINPLLDQEGYSEDVSLVDIHSKTKGDDKNE